MNCQKYAALSTLLFSLNLFSLLCNSKGESNASGKGEAKTSETQDKDEKKQHAIEVEMLNLDAFLNENKYVFVKFYAPWCTHCRQMAEDYESAAKELRNIPDLRVIKVDATNNRDLQEKYDIQGYPTLKFFRETAMEDYHGQRTTTTIVTWITNAIGSPVNIIDDPTKIPKTEKTIYLLADYKDAAYLNLFTTVADKSRKYGLYYAVNDPKKQANIVKVLRGDESDVKCDDATMEQLIAFFQLESVPIYGQIDVDTEPLYSSHPLPKIFFAGSETDHKNTLTVITNMAKELRKDFITLWVNTDKFSMYVTEELKIKDFPGIAIITSEGRYILSEFQEAIKQPAKLIQFAMDVKNGKVSRILQSDVEPEYVPGKARVIVANTFNERVMQNPNDVFLMIFAEWCGHCKAMEPAFDELAQKIYDSDYAVTIAKIDGSKNEVPHKEITVRGFPTLVLIRSGTHQVIPYQGGRTFAAMMEFIEKNCSKVDRASDEL